MAQNIGEQYHAGGSYQRHSHIHCRIPSCLTKNNQWDSLAVGLLKVLVYKKQEEWISRVILAMISNVQNSKYDKNNKINKSYQ